MNQIIGHTIKGNRVYVKVRIQGLDEITLRFYVSTNKIEFLAHLTRAINYPLIESPIFGRKDGEIEPFPHCDLVEGTMEILRNWGYTKYILTGMHQKEKGPRYEYEIIGPGKSAYVIYMNLGGYEVEPLEVFLTYEEAMFRMIQWNTEGNFINWKKLKNNTIMEPDIKIGEWLHCIDNLEELLKYKRLYQDQIKYLREMGLVKVRYFSE